MRKGLILSFALTLTAAAVAQPRSGNIYGKVLDRSETPLAGVTVTLTGSYAAPQVLVTTAEGNFRFLSLPPAKDYALKCELSGFKMRSEEGLIVVIGGTTYLALIMEAGALEEHVTVVAATPILDTKRTVIGVHVTQDILQFLPTSRDPWAILQMAPAVIMDRENVGGAESGQQSNYVARGASDYGNNTWSMDGIVITDPAAIGTSPSYYDFDAFEEMQITVGGADVTAQTGGVALNMVTRRGGNKASFGGRFYAVDEKFQATHGDKVAEFKKTERSFEGINRIKNNKDYGFNIGLPLRKDKAWFWGSYGVQDIKTSTVYGTRDDTLLENYAAKLNLQPIPQNRMEVFVHVGGKKKSGRSASAENPDGLFQQGRYHFGSPILKFQDEHMFGDDLFMSLKYAYADAGFSLAPMTDLDFNKLPVWDQTAQRYFGSQAARYRVQRPLNHYSFLINYFKDAFLGAGHDIKLGFEYSDRNQYVEDVWSGNCTLTRNFNSPVVDFSGSGLPEVPPAGISPYFTYFKFWRGHSSDQHVDAFSGYFSDTVTFGRFNLLVGLRWDKQTPWLNPFKVMAMDGGGAWDAIALDDVQQKMDALLPGVLFEQVTAKYSDGGDYNWTVWSPRLGLTWDVTGDGRTLAKVSLATYGDFMSTELADRWRSGGASGWLGFWWWDADKDTRMALNELYWANPNDNRLRSVFDGAGNFVGDWSGQAGIDWGDFNPGNPLQTTDPYVSTKKGSGSSRTSEIVLSLEREFPADLSVSVVGTYRRYDDFSWTLKYFKDAAGNPVEFQNRGWYASAGKPAGTLPGIGDTKQAKDHEWYYQSVWTTEYSPWFQVQSRPDYRQNYFGLDLIVNKRLSNRWMLNANFTWQTQARHYGSKGALDPTNLWSYEGRPQAAYMGEESGKINQYAYSRWMGKLGALYRLPWDIDVSGTFNIREGWIIREYFALVDFRLPNPKSRSAELDMTSFGSGRLPVFYNLSLRLEKMIELGDSGRIYVMADLFNVLNSAIVNRRYQKFLGTYYAYPDPTQDNFVPYPNNYALNEILNPRVLRLGVRFSF